jgi:3-phenylpropionate/cinnamic acid dioxygenase small subunit
MKKKKTLKRKTDINTTSDCEDEEKVTRLGVTVENTRISGESIGFVEVKLDWGNFQVNQLLEELI